MTFSDREIDAFRSASRRHVRRLGFLRPQLAESGLPPSSVHALIEIGACPGLSARDLSALLGLEKSSVSRLLEKLRASGLIGYTVAPGDARTKHLSLTAEGAERLAAIEGLARDQVRGALSRLSEPERHAARYGIELYANALADESQDMPSPSTAHVVSGWRPGLIGRCIEMHARHYNEVSGFGHAFETIVATGLAELATRLDRNSNAIWAALIGDRIVGTIAIDGEDLNTTCAAGDGDRIAHLRFFIVAPSARGTGLGKALLQAALDFVDTHAFSQTHLWTFKGLDAARRLYESSGFHLVEERPGNQWGAEVLEQRFVRERPEGMVRTAGIEPA